MMQKSLFLVLFVLIVECKDYVFTTAYGYSEEEIEPFIVSLRWCGFTGEIYVAVKDVDLPRLSKFAEKYSVKLLFANKPENRKINSVRFEWYEEWAKPLLQGDNILISDLRDAFFQANPFAHHYYTNRKNIHLFTESISISECKWNRWWIVNCYGDEELMKLAQRRAICAGTILGDAIEVKNLLRTLIAGIRNNTKCEEDQGTLNYLYYNHYLGDKVIIQNPGEGAVHTLGYVKKSELSIGESNLFVLNNDGIRSALTHQYDRHEELAQHYRRLVQFMKFILERKIKQIKQ
jgi:hypothetical protein